MSQSPSKTIFQIIADGLDASVDGRGFGPEHLAAVRLANAAPELLEALKDATAYKIETFAEEGYLDLADLLTFFTSWREFALAAIAKAEGVSNV